MNFSIQKKKYQNYLICIICYRIPAAELSRIWIQLYKHIVRIYEGTFLIMKNGSKLSRTSRTVVSCEKYNQLWVHERKGISLLPVLY
jgi:hypothetical protein